MKTESQITDAATDRIANLSPAKRELLARRLKEKEQKGQGQRSIPRRSRTDAETHAPLSFDQERHWFIDQLETSHAVNNAPDGVLLHGRLNVPALEQALSEIMRRHEILRTSFQQSNGSPVQVVAPARPFKLPFIDLSGLAEAAQQKYLRLLAQAEESKRFELTQGPLLRASLQRLNDDTHVLLLTAHHIICDTWSMDVLNQELGALYQAYARGERSPLEELPIQFGDFAAWQRQRLQGEFLEQLLNYWKRQLADAPAVLDLPTDKPRPAVQNYRGGTESIELPDATLQALQRLSREAGATLFMTLLAAFKVLLSRYTGTHDIIVGTPIGGRNQLETEPLIGLFVNTLVMRTDLSGNPTFRELLGRVSEVTLGALAHRELPFEKLVVELQPERAVSHTPLFQVAFDLQRPVKASLALPQLSVSPLESVSQTAKFDLAIFITEKTDGLTITIKYNVDLFEPATIRRMLGHTRNLLESIVADPQQRLSELSFLGADERRQLLYEWNETRVEYNAGGTLHQHFEAKAAETPQAVALVCEGQQLSYGELNERANQLAHHLRKRGIVAETRVGLCIERSLEMIVGLLGILKAGAAYLPLDPTYPRERLRFMLDESAAPVLLTQQRLASVLPEHGAQVIYLDTHWDEIAQESNSNPVANVLAENLAYIIYTSGSTGTPKGVCVSHHNLLQSTFARLDYYSSQPKSFLLLSSFAFDSSVAGIFWTLCAGGTLVLPEEGLQRDAHALVRLIRQRRVSHLLSLPSLHALMLEVADASELESLDVVIVAGEACSPELVRRHFETLPETNLYNEYGPTEATVWSSVYQCLGDEGEGRQVVPIGRPIANARLYILDDDLRPLPIGVAGELYIGGEGLTRGYLQRSEVTAERFVPDPFGKGARLYRTGDMTRYLPDGNIEFLGRSDSQVKIRGFRIELGEIEAALMEEATVREAVVVAADEASGGKRLVAYLVWEQAAEASGVDELRQKLKERLPEYMIPATFVFLAEMPLSPNGKIDRRALSTADQSAPELKRAYMPPLTDAERTIAQVWQEVLKVEKVGVTDNFFDLGGHSLSMVQVYTKLRAAFVEREFTVIDLFRYPTVSAVAQFLNPSAQQQAAAVQTQEHEATRLEEGKDRLRQLKQRRQASRNN
jgi:amino acid adenylation domain-containing protein